VDLKNRCHFSTIAVTRPIFGRVTGISDGLRNCQLRPQTPARVHDPSDGAIGFPRFLGRRPHPKALASIPKISRGNRGLVTIQNPSRCKGFSGPYCCSKRTLETIRGILETPRRDGAAPPPPFGSHGLEGVAEALIGNPGAILLP
jgi:hypothetical protein